MKVILCFLISAQCLHAATTEPGAAAIAFLEKVREGTLDLSPGADTAITAQTGERKRDQIAKQYARIAKDLGTAGIEIGAVKMDENFAAVIVRKISTFDPANLRIFPLAMVKRDTKWLVAPVAASFENAGVGFAIPLQSRLEALEKWMLREQVMQMEALRENAQRQLRAEIESRLPIDENRKLDASTLPARFLTACESRDLPALLGLLGGLSEKLPSDWSVRLRATRLALGANGSEDGAWHLLLAPEVLRIIHQDEHPDDEGFFTIACLDPASRDPRTALPRIALLHFEFSQDASLAWEILPPDSLLSPDEDTDEAQDLEAEYIAAFASQWQDMNPATPQATPEAAQEKFIAALAQKNLNDFLKLILLGKDPQAAAKAITLGAKLWWDFHATGAVKCTLPLRFAVNERYAQTTVQFFTAREPQRLDLQTIYFEKSAAGWLWTPETLETTRQLFPTTPPPTREQWQAMLLADSMLITQLPPLPAPSDQAAADTLAAWQKATAAGDLTAALKLTARLDDPRGTTTLLRNLAHEITSARRTGSIAKTLATHLGNSFTAVGVKIDYQGKATFPLYPMVQTPLGPRILVEIDLFALRSQALLNRISLERLANLVSKPAAEDLTALLEEFQKSVVPPP